MTAGRHTHTCIRDSSAHTRQQTVSAPSAATVGGADAVLVGAGGFPLKLARPGYSCCCCAAGSTRWLQ
jgi:hypothetical protein